MSKFAWLLVLAGCTIPSTIEVVAIDLPESVTVQTSGGRTEVTFVVEASQEYRAYGPIDIGGDGTYELSPESKSELRVYAYVYDFKVTRISMVKGDTRYE